MRVLLINPPSPERLGAPLLGFQHVAAALVREGNEVRVIDAAARHFAHDAQWVERQVHDFQPQVLALALFTRWVWHAYRLAQRLRGVPALRVAGGAHATVCPEETLAQGFDVALAGEAELSIVALVQALREGRPLTDVPGIWVRLPDGTVQAGPPASFVEDLDALAPPHTAQHLFDPAVYDAEGREVVPGGILTSRVARRAARSAPTSSPDAASVSAARRAWLKSSTPCTDGPEPPSTRSGTTRSQRRSRVL